MINVIWYNGCFGNWDHGLLASLMDGDARFVQHNHKDSNPVHDEAIIIVGKPQDPAGLRNYLVQIKKGIIILVSDEDSEWDWTVIPAHLQIWTQYYFRNKEAIEERMLLGFPTRLKDVTINKNMERLYYVSFVGQVQNQHRQQCVKELKKIPNNFIKISDGFGGLNGLEYQDYINILCKSKIVLCPSGSMCTDSFRVYETLECGALPIVETRSPRDSKNFDYWFEINKDVPFPFVDDWADLQSLLEAGGEKWIKLKTKECIDWWNNYKIQIKEKLLKSNF